MKKEKAAIELTRDEKTGLKYTFAFFFFFTIVFIASVADQGVHPVSIGAGMVLLFIIGMTGRFFRRKYKNEKKRMERSEESRRRAQRMGQLSLYSRALYSAFYKLPPDSRPQVEVYDMLNALDIKYDKRFINTHFHGKNFTCDCISGQRGCNDYPEYGILMNEIHGIKIALREKERRLQLLGAEEGLAMLENITLQLRAERDILTDINDELAERMA